MKKHFLSMLLLFVFVLGLGSPAAAYTEADTFDKDVKYVELGTEPDSKVEVAAESDFALDSARARTPHVYVSIIDVSPIVHIGNLDHYTCFTDFGDRKVFTATNGGIGQFKNLALTSTRINTICSQLYNALQSNAEYAGQTLQLIGWRVVTRVNYAADRPLYFDYETGETCMEGTSHHLNLGSQQVSYKDLSHNFKIKAGTYQSRYTFGMNGAYYFTSNGQSGGAAFNGSATFNSDKSLP